MATGLVKICVQLRGPKRDREDGGHGFDGLRPQVADDPALRLQAGRQRRRPGELYRLIRINVFFFAFMKLSTFFCMGRPFHFNETFYFFITDEHIEIVRKMTTISME